jgi:hypothetical protein
MRKSATIAGNMTGLALALAGAAMLFSLSAPVGACDVPVFRYALERWPAEPFNVLVFHRGELTGEQKAVTDWLAARADDANRPCNVTVTLVDVPAAGANDPNMAMSDSVAAVWEGQKDKPLPRMVACFPSPPDMPLVAWSGDLSAGAARSLVDSPARRKVVEAIGKGDSAVWVLVDCGDKAKDAAALTLLDKQLARLAKEIALPAAEDPDSADVAAADGGPPVWIGFSVVRVSRDDTAEAAFVEMLMSTEADLAKDAAGEPTVFAIFGQGRTMPALVGKGINKDNLEEYATFLCGPCSCEAKSQNPGLDLLFAADWYAPLRGMPQVTAPLPDVIGSPAVLTAATTQPVGMAAPQGGDMDYFEIPLFSRNILITFGVIFVVGAVLALWVSRMRPARFSEQGKHSKPEA